MILNNVVDYPYELILDEKGYSTVTSDKLVGELRAIKFNINNFEVMSPFYVKMFIDDIMIMDEQISSSEFYVLKLQPRDGFIQYFSVSSDFYVLNDSVRVEVSGIPDNSLFVTFRMKEV